MNNVYLVGMMGAGKTSAGRRLARRLGLAFLDLDHLVTLETGMEPGRCIRQQGEPAFRAAELRALERVARLRATVVATGGGAVLSQRGRELLCASGQVFWLDAPEEVLWGRVAGCDQRPLARDRDQFLALYIKRRPLYADTGRRVDAAEPLDAVVGAMLRLLPPPVHQAEPAEPLEVRWSGGAYPVEQLPSVRAAGEWLAARQDGPFMMVAPPVVAALFADELGRGLGSRGAAVAQALVPDGEEHKTLATVEGLYHALAAARLPRGGTVVALGGGVTGDVAGFAAATYLRGTALAQVPTTLLAQVDSSIGGKTGVNLPAGKNLVGAFHQPVASLLVPACLLTLPADEYRQGLAEVVKCALLAGDPFLDWLEWHTADLSARAPAAVARAVYLSCRLKAGLVAADERDHGPRRHLNLGHTLAHALEATSGYGSLGHGDAVALGLVWACLLSADELGAPEALARRVTVLLRRLGLPLALPAHDPAQVLEYMGQDKKRDQAGLQLVLLEAPGRPVVRSGVSRARLLAALGQLEEVIA